MLGHVVVTDEAGGDIRKGAGQRCHSRNPSQVVVTCPAQILQKLGPIQLSKKLIKTEASLGKEQGI